jgi:hypothetical protein
MILCTYISLHVICGLLQFFDGRFMLVDQRVHLAQLRFQFCQRVLAWGFFLPCPMVMAVVAIRILLQYFEVHI